jgi:hypothetical protein
MATVEVKSFVIDNIDSTDAAIKAGINVTSVVFGVSVVPISNTQSRVIIFYN